MQLIGLLLLAVLLPLAVAGQEPGNEVPPLVSAVLELYGILDLPADFDYKTQLDERAL